MYQIFVDRFCNGNPDNDVLDREYWYLGGYTERVKNWDAYPKAMDVRSFYGGDLEGVIDKLDYLQGLGVDVIYFNPIFVSPPTTNTIRRIMTMWIPTLPAFRTTGGRFWRRGIGTIGMPPATSNG